MSELTTTPQEKQTDLLQRPLLAVQTLDWEKIIYITFVILAIVTRFWGLGDRVMSHDESLHTQFSYQFYNGEGYVHTPLMHGPFLFHITAVSYWLFGPSDFSARLPVALFGIVLVIMPYFLRKWIGRVGALFASFFFLISPYITYYSRYIRHDIYVIVWALIVFIAMWLYLHKQEEKYLWWFAAGTALMFATKEVAFIYVAIFGSLLVIRLLLKLLHAEWIGRILPDLRPAAVVVLLALVMIGAGGYLLTKSGQPEDTAVSTPAETGFAANPETDTAVTTETSQNHVGLRVLIVAGITVLGIGLFMGLQKMRPFIDSLPEFDLIMLFTSFVLPMASPILVIIMGWNPRDYTFSSCMLEGQQTMTPLQILLGRMSQSVCWQAFWDSGMVRSGGFLLITLFIGILLGLWWNNRKWVIAAAIFHSIFMVLYTSVFTNPGGWASGMIGSLGYWWEQHDVQRGGQPGFYYLFVTPFYEFLPLIFSMLAVRLWSKQKKLNRLVGYWLTLGLLVVLSNSLMRWLYGRTFLLANQEIPPVTGRLSAVVGNTAELVGLLAGLLAAGLGILFWYFVQRHRLAKLYQLEGSLFQLLTWRSWLEFVPAVTWWLILTAAAYSIAGEKMPWLSTHFVIPMAFLAGWYFEQRLKGQSAESLLGKWSMLLIGGTTVLIIAALMAVGPVLLGKVTFGSQTQQSLNGIGRFLGMLVVSGILVYLWRLIYEKAPATTRQPAIILGVFVFLSLLTIRFTYMANWPNADYTNEFLVYAHGAPATKEIVMKQVEELSQRLYGDKSIRVAFDNDVSWPFTWYLRDYPNRYYFGDQPSQSLNDSPIILAGSLNWGSVEPYLGNRYEARTYTFLWWPMEEYRRFGWDTVFGSPTLPNYPGLGSAEARQAYWDIFFYRDYKKYGEVFGGDYSAASWPLRHELRVYIRKDVLSNLWDYGLAAVNASGLEDPYAEGELQAEPVMVINETGVSGPAEGQLFAPRNLAVGQNGRLYVADSGNHRIQVFDSETGEFITGWGEFGAEPGQFNEPWGIAVTEDAVFVADTWNHRIQKFTLDGELLAVYGRSGRPADEPETNGLGLFFGPRDILALGDGRFLISDTGNHRFQLMDADGNFLGQAGGFGNLPGQMNEPVGITMAPDGTIFLADTWNGRVQQFTPDLTPIAQWPVDGWFGQSTNNKPYIATDSAERVYVTDPENFRVLIFSQFGDYIGRYGRFGTDVNALGLPNGIKIDANDNIYIADATNNRILKFAPFFGDE